MFCGNCGIQMEYVISAERNDHIYRFYQCKQCGKPDHTVGYAHTPETCPGHQWMFHGTEFVDGIHAHSIEQVFKCDRCGVLYRRPMHTKAVGMSGRIEVDHPKVSPTLLYNKTCWDLKMPDDIKSEVPNTAPEQAIIPPTP